MATEQYFSSPIQNELMIMTTNKQARILIIIVTWNKQQYVIDLLNSISILNYPSESMDIVVVDNASTDSTVELIRQQFNDVHLICNKENIGGSGGFNTGLAWAFEQQDYDYLWLLDNDVKVHKNALIELLNVLEEQSDVAIAGSTMMQLDCPYQINEMGAFVDRGNGQLLFNRHNQKVPSLQGRDVDDLIKADLDLSQIISECQSWMDVDYVAAASLLIRADIAKEAGLWDDFFIHFDDVGWCQHIADKGYRIVVSAQSVIWHMSAVTKVPSWILYYDNRNILYLLEKYGYSGSIARSKKWTLKKSLYYALIGKPDISALHLNALNDYDQRVKGKKDIALDSVYLGLEATSEILLDDNIKRVLMPWTVNLQASNLQHQFVSALQKRNDLHIDFISDPTDCVSIQPRQLPKSNTIYLPKSKLKRLWAYYRLRNRYDLVIQSDYQAIIPLSWIAENILFINYEGISHRKRATVKDIRALVKTIFIFWRRL
ncbi:MAG: glycosyltransferase family 2 protein [Candidatus Thiodiazotropha sp. (ex Ustalcina ferruginea)]|nr:glycosyltransferase family 2 protein [Candidatus Thiodiazotropha sp. (ex Ustalcina ferruginea)]